MRVNHIVVEGMYGHYDFSVDLNLDQRVTIIHGSNGLGKSTFLRLVHNTLRGAWGGVSRAPFRILTVRFDDGVTLEVRNGGPTEWGHTHRSLTVRAVRPGEAGVEWRPTTLPECVARTWELVGEAHPNLLPLGNEEWLDRHTGNVLDVDGLLARRPESVELLRSLLDEPEWLATIVDAMPERLIGADRLIVWDPDGRRVDAAVRGWMPAVTWCSRVLVDQLRSAQKAYTATSYALDRTFPMRVLADGSEPPPEVELRRRYAEHTATLERLHRVSLIEEPEAIELPDRALDTTERRMLATYLQDAQAKADVFGSLLVRLEALLGGTRFRLLNKSIGIDRDRGIVVRTDTGDEIPLSSLSSGEQHIIVLAATLLFEVEPGSLVLLDEPELSLHIAWQQALVDRLLDIAALRSLDFVVATHSPQIVHTHWDLAVDLEGLDEAYDPDEG